MAFTNFDTKEINCKILYCGPVDSGKSENLRSIFANTSEEVRFGLMELESKTSERRLFDFLPLEIGQTDGFKIKLHLFTLPHKHMLESLGDVMLKGVDGVVFVADSRIQQMASNLECFQDASDLFREHGYVFADLPKVIQYNKRDLEDIVPLDLMKTSLNAGHSIDVEAIASQSIGTLETLEAMAKQVLHKLNSFNQ